MKAMHDVWGDTLVSLGNTNPNVLYLDADLANSTKADKFSKMYPQRFLQMGIAEQNFVRMAVDWPLSALSHGFQPLRYSLRTAQSIQLECWLPRLTPT